MHMFYIEIGILNSMETQKSDLKRFFDLPALCPAFNIRAASRIITQLFDEILKPSGMQITQFAVLVGVQILDTPSISELARGLVMDRTTLTRGLKPLENDGLIKIVSGDDKRTHFVKITPKGVKALQKTLPYWEKARTVVSEEFGQKHLDGLLKDLASVREIKN
jgi:DNA-binding MarR family transcriptional regulator